MRANCDEFHCRGLVHPQPLCVTLLHELDLLQIIVRLFQIALGHGQLGLKSGDRSR